MYSTPLVLLLKKLIKNETFIFCTCVHTTCDTVTFSLDLSVMAVPKHPIVIEIKLRLEVSDLGSNLKALANLCPAHRGDVEQE